MNPDPIRAEVPKVAAAGPAAPLINWKAARPLDVATVLVGRRRGPGWAYAPNFASLVRTWNREPDYSHGFLVIPIALVILWKTWPADPESARGPVASGLAAGGRGPWSLAPISTSGATTWSESATLLPVIAGLALAAAGWRCMPPDLAGVRVPDLPVPLPPRSIRPFAAAPVAGHLVLLVAPESSPGSG